MNQSELFPSIKKCNTCQIDKPIEQFSKLSGMTEKRRGSCKPCERGKLQRQLKHYDKCSCGRLKRSSSIRCDDCHTSKNAEEVINANGKYCPGCKTKQDASQFGKRLEKGVTRFRSRCKQCECRRAKSRRQRMTIDERKANRKARYIKEKSRPWIKRRIAGIRRFCRDLGWNLATTEKVIEDFKNSKTCQICKQERPLVIDHCHDTNEYRGLLCSPCNQAIGLMMDSESIMRSAAAYVLRLKKVQ